LTGRAGCELFPYQIAAPNGRYNGDQAYYYGYETDFPQRRHVERDNEYRQGENEKETGEPEEKFTHCGLLITY
jgi:hypothetical protein